MYYYSTISFEFCVLEWFWAWSMSCYSFCLFSLSYQIWECKEIKNLSAWEFFKELIYNVYFHRKAEWLSERVQILGSADLITTYWDTWKNILCLWIEFLPCEMAMDITHCPVMIITWQNKIIGVYYNHDFWKH